VRASHSDLAGCYEETTVIFDGFPNGSCSAGECSGSCDNNIGNPGKASVAFISACSWAMPSPGRRRDNFNRRRRAKPAIGNARRAAIAEHPTRWKRSRTSMTIRSCARSWPRKAWRTSWWQTIQIDIRFYYTNAVGTAIRTDITR